MNDKRSTMPVYYSSITDRLPAPFVKINVMETPAGYTLDFHSHDYYHINHIHDGTLEVEYAGKCYQIGAGQTVILPPVQPHRLFSPTGYRQIGMDLRECPDERGLSRYLCETCPKRLSVTGCQVGRIDYTRMRELLSLPSEPNRMRVINLAESLLLDAFETLGEDDVQRDTFVQSFHAMLAECEPWNLTLGDMCGKLGMSRSTLERTARRVFGCGASEYCARIRFIRIGMLLKTTCYTLDTIAEMTGFYDAGHLSVFFYKRSGITPGQYRCSGNKKGD